MIRLIEIPACTSSNNPGSSPCPQYARVYSLVVSGGKSSCTRSVLEAIVSREFLPKSVTVPSCFHSHSFHSSRDSIIVVQHPTELTTAFALELNYDPTSCASSDSASPPPPSASVSLATGYQRIRYYSKMSSFCSRVSRSLSRVTPGWV